MKELQDAVAAAFAKVVESGAIEKAIEDEIGKTVTRMVRGHLESYGDFGKALNEKIKAAMQIDMDKLGLQGYNDFVLKVIREKFAATQQDAMKQIADEMDSLLSPAPKEIKLTQLIEQFIEANADRHSDSGNDRITLHVDASGNLDGYHHIAIDPEARKGKYSCRYRMQVNPQGEVFALRIEEQEVKKALLLGPYFNFDRAIYQMFAAGTKLIVDGTEDDIDTYYPGRG